MASATSESYCNHLRGQLKEWERAFRSRNGRFPKQPDYEALENDGSARGRLVHGAYMALNHATGDSFIKVGGYRCCSLCAILYRTRPPPPSAEGVEFGFWFGWSILFSAVYRLFLFHLVLG